MFKGAVEYIASSRFNPSRLECASTQVIYRFTDSFLIGKPTTRKRL